MTGDGKDGAGGTLYDVSENVAVIRLDMPGRMNVLNAACIAQLGDCVERALADPDVRGAVVASGKSTFLAGADLHEFERLMGRVASLPERARAAAMLAGIGGLSKLFRRIETGGKPFAAAINGTALGGGLGLALACHRRFVADDPAIALGMPESKVGLMPLAGGTQRLPRMIGAIAALPLLLEGKSMTPAEAHAARIVDEIVPPGALLDRACAWVRSATGTDATKPWDAKGYLVPGAHRATAVFTAANALQRKSSHGNYPALDAILGAVHDGLTLPMDLALRVELKYAARLLCNPAARAMVRTLFSSMQHARSGAARPAGHERKSLVRIGVVGAGMMGAGIAHVAARAGIDVVLIDRNQAAADAGAARAKEASARITATTDFAALSGVELVIEAVFEDRAIKADVTRRAEAVIGAGAVFASNTSTLPITGLAEASARPDQFIGLHFFSPVERMPLLEIIRGERTSDATLALAMDFARAMGKTPIVVRDSRGFFTSRVFATYTNEGVRMLAEGIAPALIENAGKSLGMPVAPLALCDEVALDLMHRVSTQTRADLGDAWRENPAQALVATMVDKLGRTGRKAGRGFYEYPQDGGKFLWPGLADLAPAVAAQPSIADLKSRLLAIQMIEAARCFAEGVIGDPADADVGAILGWGFAPWTGGPLSHIDTLGAAALVRDCDILAQRHGERFSPTPQLRDMARTGARFYAAPRQAA